MNIVLAAATELELNPVLKLTSKLSHNIHPLITGIGTLLASFELHNAISTYKPDWIIQVGIAGSFKNTLPNRSVIGVSHEFLGDLGVQDSDHFKDVFDMNFLNPNSSPFQNKALYNPHWNKISILPFPLDDAITVNEITSNPSRVQQLIQNYKPGIESMEGAALHYTCLRLNQPFLQIRAISNKITDRDKSRWDIPGALENLALKTRELLNSLP